MQEKRKKKRDFKKEKGDSLFLEKRNPGGCSEYPHKLSIPMRCKRKYFLSRGKNAVRHSVPAQIMRDLLKSSLNVGQYFQLHVFAEFHVREEIAQAGWAVPNNREAINGNGIALIVGQTVEWRFILGACYTFVPEFLYCF
jgi:hypothetical protein